MEASRSFTNADDARLIDLIQSAKRRLVFAAPGISTAVGQALAHVVTTRLDLTQIVVILDIDPEVCRFGYGTMEGLEQAQRALEFRQLQLQSAGGLRVGLLISDDQTLIYSPPVLLIEAGSTAPSKPNAIFLQPNPTEAIAAACGASANTIAPTPQEMGLSPVDPIQLNQVKDDLTLNPPKQFNLARLERVFNYELQFVEFKVEGYRLGRKILPLKSEWLGLDDRELKDRFHNTFRLFGGDAPLSVDIPRIDESGSILANETQKISEETITDQANELRKSLIPLGSYGSVILKRKRAAFERGVAALRACVEAYRDKLNEILDNEIAEVRRKLIDTLTPGLLQKPPESWLDASIDGSLDEAGVRRRLGDGVDRTLARIRKEFCPEVTLVFKDVTYTTIVQDPAFRQRLEEHFGPDEIRRLFREWESARAKEPSSLPTNP